MTRCIGRSLFVTLFAGAELTKEALPLHWLLIACDIGCRC